jgi:hypothetical protein
MMTGRVGLSEKWVIFSHLSRLIAQQDFINFSSHENSYTPINILFIIEIFHVKFHSNYVVIDSMQLKLSWESAGWGDNQELPNTLLNQEVHYCAHKGLPIVPVPSNINPVQTALFYRLTYIWMQTLFRLLLPTLSFQPESQTCMLFYLS